MGNLVSILTLLVTGILAYWIRFGVMPLSNNYVLAILISLLLASLVLPATGAYRPQIRGDFARRSRRLIAGWALVAVSLIALAAALKVTSEFSRIWFGNWVLLAMAGLLLIQAGEFLWRRLPHPGRVRKKRLVLVGNSGSIGNIERRLATG